MLKAIVYRLYLAKTQQRSLDRTLETCRRWYNRCLAERKDAYEQEKRTIGKYEQLRQVKTYKATNPYAGAVHSHVLQTVVQDLDKAFQAFFRRVKAGEEPGYPRFKGKHRFKSFGFKEYGNGFKVDGRRLKIAGIGRVAVRWHRNVPGTIKSPCLLPALMSALMWGSYRSSPPVQANTWSILPGTAKPKSACVWRNAVSPDGRRAGPIAARL